MGILDSLNNWLGDSNEISQPKVLQQAKALRQRKLALQNRQALAGEGNIFQRRKQGIDSVVNQAVQ